MKRVVIGGRPGRRPRGPDRRDHHAARPHARATSPAVHAHGDRHEPQRDARPRGEEPPVQEPAGLHHRRLGRAAATRSTGSCRPSCPRRTCRSSSRRIPRQHETDLGLVRRLAQRNGFVFYIEPVTFGVNKRVLGPGDPGGHPAAGAHDEHGRLDQRDVDVVRERRAGAGRPRAGRSSSRHQDARSRSRRLPLAPDPAAGARRRLPPHRTMHAARDGEREPGPRGPRVRRRPPRARRKPCSGQGQLDERALRQRCCARAAAGRRARRGLQLRRLLLRQERDAHDHEGQVHAELPAERATGPGRSCPGGAA